MSFYLGIRNNNALNIKQPYDDTWDGSVGQDAKGHAVFHNPAAMWRAFYRLTFRKTERGILNLDSYIKDYAPESDGNDPGYYLGCLANRGFDINKTFTFFDKDGSPSEALNSLGMAMVSTELMAGWREDPFHQFNGKIWYMRDFIS